MNVIVAITRKNKANQQSRFGLWCLMPLLAIFQLYGGGKFHWWRKSHRGTIHRKLHHRIWRHRKLHHRKLRRRKSWTGNEREIISCVLPGISRVFTGTPLDSMYEQWNCESNLYRVTITLLPPMLSHFSLLNCAVSVINRLSGMCMQYMTACFYFLLFIWFIGK